MSIVDAKLLELKKRENEATQRSFHFHYNTFFLSSLTNYPLRPSTRRSGASHMSNIVFGSVIGIISGRYIFEEPLRNHFEKQNQQLKDSER